MIALGYILIAIWASIVLVSIARLFFINKNAPDPKDPGRSTPTEVSASNVSQ